MTKSFKGLIGFLIIFQFIAMFVVAGDNYVTYFGEPVGYDSFVETAGVLNSDTAYNWGVNITGTNITSVLIGGLTADNLTGPFSTTGVYGISYVPSGVADFQNNCTYVSFTVSVTALNASGASFTNTTTQADLTVIPCIESSDASAYSMKVTDVNTSSLYLSNSSASDTVVWMMPLGYNASNGTCNYGCGSDLDAVTKCYSTSYLAGPDANRYCEVNVNRGAGNFGVVEVSGDASLDISTPSNIPAATLGSIVVIIVAYAVTRVKRRGGVKEV